MAYMLDTNIFGNLVSGELSLADLPQDGDYWATPIQVAELRASSGDLQQRLLSKFKEIVNSNAIVRVAFSFDVLGAGFDEGEWRNDASLYDALKTGLDAAWKKENNIQDALIAEATILHGLTLLTADKALAEVARKHGIKARYLKPRAR